MNPKKSFDMYHIWLAPRHILNVPTLIVTCTTVPFWIFFFWNFFCFFPMITSQSLLVSKDGSKFLSRHKWQHFLTQTKHFEGECSTKSNEIFETVVSFFLAPFFTIQYYYGKKVAVPSKICSGIYLPRYWVDLISNSRVTINFF